MRKSFATYRRSNNDAITLIVMSLLGSRFQDRFDKVKKRIISSLLITENDDNDFWSSITNKSLTSLRKSRFVKIFDRHFVSY